MQLEKVLYVTLEMSKESIGKRVVQNIFSIPEVYMSDKITELENSETGDLSLHAETLNASLTLGNKDFAMGMRAEIEQFAPRFANLAYQRIQLWFINIG